MQDVIIRIVYDLPYTVGAYTAWDAYGCANIYVNGNWPEEEQHKAVLHELIHDSANHLYGEDVESMEQEARDQSCQKPRNLKAETGM